METISGYTKQHNKRNHQHRETRETGYMPVIAPADRLTESGTLADINFRSAYFKSMEPTFPGSSLLTGFAPGNVIRSLRTVGEYIDHPPRLTVGDIGGVLAYGTVINLEAQTLHDIKYGNPHVSAFYTLPWRDMLPIPGIKIALATHKPYYHFQGRHRGGSVSLIVHLYRTGAQGGHGISIVIKLYSLSERQGNTADRVARVDPNNGRLHITSHVGPDNKYFSADPQSAHTSHSRSTDPLGVPFGDLYQIEFTREKLERLLLDAGTHSGRHQGGSDEWKLGMVATHVELNEGFTGGKKEGDSAMCAAAVAGLRVWV